MTLQVFFSNRIETLFDELRANLYANKTPFAKRLVMVATSPLKAWLMLELAEKGGVAAGLEIGTIEETFRKILKAERPFPKTEEVALALEMEIQGILQDPFRDDIWDPLIRYLGHERKKLTPFSFELAQLFQKYNLYAPRLGSEWDKGGWQRALWDRLFGLRTAPWSAPYQGYTQGEILQLPQGSLDVFAVSFLPKVQLDFLQRLSQKIPVRLYCLSPCELFWSDLVPDKEKARGAQFQVEQPLLANFGKVGRAMAKWIEESSAETFELYPHEPPQSLLEHLQYDMQTLRNYQETPTIHLAKDHSVQIHGAPSLLREVEIVQQLLLQIVAEKGVEPREILVMAPDISPYAPFIPAIFNGDHFTPHVSDLRMPALEPLIQSFIHLLTFARGRWSSQDFFNLLESPFFIKKRGWDNQQTALIKEWITGSGILWGEDASHRQQLLKQMYGEAGSSLPHHPGTWKFGFQRLLAGLIQTTHEDIAPYPLIESTQGELLGDLIGLFNALKKDLSPLIDGSEFTLTQWGEKLKQLFVDYLDYKGAEDQAAPIFKIRETLVRAGVQYDDSTVPFSTIQKHFEYSLSQSSTRYKETNLQTVRFCSLLPLRTVPAKVVVLMGMQEGAFPRQEAPLSFDLLHNNPVADFCPSKGDMDRFVFLEALLSARQTILFTYQCKNREDFKDQGPSLLIEELLSAIEAGYRIQIPHVIHSLNRFDPKYFTADSPQHNYSRRDFEAAQIHNQSEKRTPRFMEDIPLPIQAAPLEAIAFEDLKGFIKDPYKTFFNKTLGMYLEEGQLEQREAFVHSGLEFSAMKRKVPLETVDEILHSANKEGKLPIANFLHSTAARLNEEMEALKAFGIRLDSIEEVEFRLPLSLPLTGKLALVTPEGLLVQRKKTSQTLIETWPAFLVYLYLKKGKPRLLFLGDGKVADGAQVNPVQELEKLIQYYQSALPTGSPLDPGLISNGSSYSAYVAWLQRNGEITLGEEWKRESEHLFGTIKEIG